MTKDLQASIIINNYNYGRFLAEAIDSALNQTYANTEVIVVDDGSTDNSREIIARYDERIIPVLKENGGQASAFNAGFSISRGDIILFLDSDDVLLSTAIEKAVPFFDDPDVAKTHWSLLIIDEYGEKTGQVIPKEILPEGDFREAMIREGPSCCASPPTSGNIFSQSFLKRIFPMSETEYKLCADDYLYALAPAFGIVKRILEPQGFYRIHGSNNYQFKTFEEKLKLGLQSHQQQFLALKEIFRQQGINADIESWEKKSWFFRLRLATDEIAALIPADEVLILVDDDGWGINRTVVNRQIIPFLERNGQFWGAPSDDETAVRELERLRQTGGSFIVFAWTAFWWLEYYAEFHNYLCSKFPCLLENERLVIFDLRTEL